MTSRLAAILAAVSLTSCAAAPVRPSETATESARAVPCSPEQPCAYLDGVWLPPPLAAQTAGWGTCCAECKEKLKSCNRVGADTAAFIVVGILSGLVTGAAVAGVYELRDWMRR